MMISLLVPSKGRPKLANALDRRYRDIPEVEVLFYLTESDSELDFYDVEESVVGIDQPTSASWNFLATEAVGDILVLFGDDAMFESTRWYLRLAEAMPEDGIGVLSFDDGRTPIAEKPCPHPVISRRMYEQLGYIAWPLFYHWCVDKWLKTIAWDLGRYIFLEDVVCRHRKIRDANKVRMRKGWHDRDNETFKLSEPLRKLAVEGLRKCMST